MPWEGKPLREVREADVRQLIDSGVEEHLRLEYKSALYDGNDRGNKECLLDLCMFANSGGGFCSSESLRDMTPKDKQQGFLIRRNRSVSTYLNPDGVLLSYDARVVAGIEERLPLESAPTYNPPVNRGNPPPTQNSSPQLSPTKH